MLQWNQLPVEILEVIFAYLANLDGAKANLQQCSLVCRDWGPLAQKSIFSKVTLSNFDDIVRLTGFLLDEDTRHFGKAVKKLDCNAIVFQTEVEALATLLSFVPYLAELHIRSNIVFYRLFSSGLLPHISVLPAPINKEEDEWYINALPIVKPRLTTIHVIRDEPHERDTITELKNELYQFKNLKSIIIHLTFNSLSSSLDYFGSIYKGFSRPVSLKINFQTFQHGPRSEVSAHTLQPFINVKDLEIECHYLIFWTDDTDYIMSLKKMFPNLDSLWISISEPFSLSQTTRATLSIDTISQFLKYVLKIREFSVEKFITNDHTLSIITDVYGTLENTPFRRLPHSLYLHHIPIVFNTEDVESVSFSRYYENNLFQVKVENTGERLRSLFDLVKATGYIYEEVCVDNVSSYNGTSILDYIIMYCTNLTTLHIRNNTELPHSALPQNHPLKSLVLSDYMMFPKFFPILEGCFPNLENLTLRECLHIKSNVEINMSATSFRNLTLVINLKKIYMYNRVIVQIITEVEEKSRLYCLDDQGNTVRLDNQTVEDVLNEKCAFYLIRCKSFDNFSLSRC